MNWMGQARSKFAVGDLVEMTRLGKDWGLTNRRSMTGRVVGFSRLSPASVRVLLDGYKTPQGYHMEFFRTVK